jgi:hypothetical protein
MTVFILQEHVNLEAYNDFLRFTPGTDKELTQKVVSLMSCDFPRKLQAILFFNSHIFMKTSERPLEKKYDCFSIRRMQSNVRLSFDSEEKVNASGKMKIRTQGLSGLRLSSFDAKSDIKVKSLTSNEHRR